MQREVESSSLSDTYKMKINKETDTVFDNKQNDVEWIHLIKKYKDIANYPKFSPRVLDVDESNINLIVHQAIKHRDANVPSILDDSMSERDKIEKQCTCGCKKIKGNQISLFVRTQELYFLGSAISLFFHFLKMSIIGVAFTVLFYSVFSFGSNMIGESAQTFLQKCQDGMYCKFVISTSMINKFEWDLVVMIQYWLGVLISFAWVFLTWYMRYSGKYIEDNILTSAETPSTKAVKIENLPAGQYSQENLKIVLQRAWQHRHRQRTNQGIQQIKIKAIHLVYDMSYYRELVKQIQEESIKLWSYFSKQINPNSETKQLIVKPEKYSELKRSIKHKINQLKDAYNRFNSQQQFRRRLSTTCAIVQFQKNSDHKDFMNAFGNMGSSSFWNQALVLLKCYPRDKFVEFFGHFLQIQQAPQPEDVYWKNAQKPYDKRCSIGILTIAGLIIALTGLLFFGLDYAQEYLEDNYENISRNIISIINYGKTVLILIVNAALFEALCRLIKLDRKHTLGEQLISLMTLSTLAESINSIFLPFIIQFFTRNDFFSGEGVAGVAFDFAITNALVGNALMFFDGSFIRKVMTWIKCIRNWKVRSLLKNVDFRAQGYQIKSVNEFFEGGQFDMSESYAQLMVELFHTAFYASMQPFIILILLANLCIKWLIKRYLLLRRYNYPKHYRKIIYDHVLWMLKLVPIFLGAGMIFTTRVSNMDNLKWYLLIPSAVCMLIGLINILNPFEAFDKLTDRIVACVTRKKTRLSPQEMAIIVNNIADATLINLNIENANQKTKYKQYYQTSNLVDLLGFQSTLSEGDNQKDAQQVMEFTERFGDPKKEEIV